MNRKVLTVLCFMMLMLYAMQIIMMSPLFPEIAKTYSLTISQTGAIFTANFLGFSLFIFFGGILVDLFGKKILLSVALIGNSIALFAFPFASNFTVVLLLMFVLGGFGSIVEGISSALVSDLNKERSSFYLNVAHIFFGIGAIVSPIGASYIIYSGFDWRLCYYIVSGFSAVVTVLFLFQKMPVLSISEKITISAFKELLTDKRFLLICLCLFFYTGSEGGSWGWMVTYLKNELSFTVMISGFAVAAFWFSMTAGRILIVTILHKYKLTSFIILLAFLSACITALSGVFQNPFMMWIIIFLLGFTFSSQWPLMVSYGGKTFPSYSGIVFSLLIGSGGFGIAVIPYLMGLVGDHISMRVAMILPAVFLMAIGFIFIRIAKTENKKTSKSH